MKLIVGLGNPGKAYIDSRHNIGFMVVKALAEDYGIKLKRGFNWDSLSGKGRIEGREVILAEPLTFMNLSGKAVSVLLKKRKIDKENLLIVCDDLDLQFGRLKIKMSGSSGGHRGLKSIIDHLGSKDFTRLRVGIGRPGEHIDPAEYVLSSFTKKEKSSLAGIIEKCGNCVKMWVMEGIVETMNIFNKE